MESAAKPGCENRTDNPYKKIRPVTYPADVDGAMNLLLTHAEAWAAWETALIKALRIRLHAEPGKLDTAMEQWDKWGDRRETDACHVLQKLEGLFPGLLVPIIDSTAPPPSPYGRGR